MEKKTVLITGTAGFIGFHLARRMLSLGWRVVGVDNFTPYYDVSIKEKRNDILAQNPSFAVHRISISDYAALERVIEKEKPDLIIHLAAQAGVRYSLKNPWTYADTNYLGTLDIFEAAKRLGVGKVIYASSASVYGSNTKMPFAESDRTDNPVSIYGASKKACELLAHSYHHLYKIDAIGLRFFTVYGEYGRPDLALFKFIKSILSGKEIELYNNGIMTRNFTYIDDIVDGIVGIVEKNIGGCEIYNLGGPDSISLSDFVKLIEKNVGSKATVKLVPMQQGDVPAAIADTSKAKKDFGFVPKVSIEEGVKRFARWFLANKDWLLTLKESE